MESASTGSSSNHHLFSFSAHRYTSTDQSYFSNPSYLLPWILMRDKLLSLWQNSWKRRLFVLSKSSTGNYILKYLKGQHMKGSIAVDQYVAQMQFFFFHSCINTLQWPLIVQAFVPDWTSQDWVPDSNPMKSTKHSLGICRLWVQLWYM